MTDLTRHNMIGITTEGILGLAEWGRPIWRAASATVRCTLLDKYMPWWIKPLYLLYIHYRNAIDEDVIFITPNMSKQSRRTIYLAWTASLVLVFALLPDSRRAITAYNLSGYWLAAGSALCDYVAADRPEDIEAWTWWARRNIAVLLSAWLYSCAHLHMIRSICELLIVWTCLPTAACFLICWILAKPTRYSFSILEGLRWSLYQLSGNVNRLYDVVDFVEAFLVVWVPEQLQWIYSRWIQRQRRWRNLPTYEYKALGERQIRLLHLKRSTWPFPSVIRASIEHVSVDISPKSGYIHEYEAVSYRWGSADCTEEILVDGERHRVTSSAYKLLAARRSAWKERIIWIDFICINQADKAEKAAQVRLMRVIYQRASRVIAFPDTDWLSRPAATLIYELHVASLHYAGTEVIYSFDQLANRWRWQAFEKLLQNDYFSRAWVIQEIALGTQVELYYGGYYIPWKIWFAVATRQIHLRQKLPTFKDVDPSKRDWIRPLIFHPTTVMAIWRPESKIFTRLSIPKRLESVLYTTCKFEATDARDKVFAVVGLIAGEAGTLAFTPDYAKSAETVFENVARYLFLHPQSPSIHMLSLAGVGFSSVRKEMPSWVPNLGREILNYPFTDVLFDDGRFRASSDGTACITESSLPGCLEMKGVVCDTIFRLSADGPLDIRPQRYESMFRMQIGHYMHIFTENVLKLLHESRELWPTGNAAKSEQLWRTLLTDRVSRRCPAQLALGKAFPHWRRFNELQSMMFTSNDRQALKKSRALEPVFEDIRTSFEDGSISTYSLNMMEACYDRSFAVTTKGRMGLVPPFSQPGDVVFIPFGAQTPYLIREKGFSQTSGKYWELVGEAYVHGLMMGKGMKIGHEETVTIG